MGFTPAFRHASTNRAVPYSPSRSVRATASMPSSAARRARSSGENAPSFKEKKDRTSRCTKGSTEIPTPTKTAPRSLRRGRTGRGGARARVAAGPIRRTRWNPRHSVARTDDDRSPPPTRPACRQPDRRRPWVPRALARPGTDGPACVQASGSVGSREEPLPRHPRAHRPRRGSRPISAPCSPARARLGTRRPAHISASPRTARSARNGRSASASWRVRLRRRSRARDRRARPREAGAQAGTKHPPPDRRFRRPYRTAAGHSHARPRTRAPARYRLPVDAPVETTPRSASGGGLRPWLIPSVTRSTPSTHHPEVSPRGAPRATGRRPGRGTGPTPPRPCPPLATGRSRRPPRSAGPATRTRRASRRPARPAPPRRTAWPRPVRLDLRLQSNVCSRGKQTLPPGRDSGQAETFPQARGIESVNPTPSPGHQAGGVFEQMANSRERLAVLHAPSEPAHVIHTTQDALDGSHNHLQVPKIQQIAGRQPVFRGEAVVFRRFPNNVFLLDHRSLPPVASEVQGSVRRVSVSFPGEEEGWRNKRTMGHWSPSSPISARVADGS